MARPGSRPWGPRGDGQAVGEARRTLGAQAAADKSIEAGASGPEKAGDSCLESNQRAPRPQPGDGSRLASQGRQPLTWMAYLLSSAKGTLLHCILLPSLPGPPGQPCADHPRLCGLYTWQVSGPSSEHSQLCLHGCCPGPSPSPRARPRWNPVGICTHRS